MGGILKSLLVHVLHGACEGEHGQRRAWTYAAFFNRACAQAELDMRMLPRAERQAEEHAQSQSSPPGPMGEDNLQ